MKLAGPSFDKNKRKTPGPYRRSITSGTYADDSQFGSQVEITEAEVVNKDDKVPYTSTGTAPPGEQDVMQILLERPVQERRQMPLYSRGRGRTANTSAKANQGSHRSKTTITTEEARQSGDPSEVIGSSTTITTEEASQSAVPSEVIGSSGLPCGKDLWAKVCPDGRGDQGGVRRFRLFLLAGK